MSFGSIALEIFSSLANSNYNIQRSAFLAPGSKLDNKRTFAQTDRNGIAKLYIRIKESPVDSQVRLVCESGKAKTPPSQKIKIRHQIKKITVPTAINEKISKQFKRNEEDYLPTEVKMKSKVKLQLWEDENTDVDVIRAEDFKIDLIKYQDLVDYKNANISVVDAVQGVKNSTDVSSAFDQIWSIFNTLMRGVQTVKTIKENQKRVSNVKFDRPKIENYTAVISNITLTVDEPGEYALIFSANGVYTSIFDNETKITVKDDIPTMKRYFDYFETAITTAFYFVVLLFASKLVKGYWLFLAFLVIALYAYIITYKSGVSLTYMIAVYTFAGIVSIFLLWSFIIYFVDSWIKKKEPSYFYAQKRQISIEYTFQRLNGHPSNYWVNKKKKLGLNIKKFYNDTDFSDLPKFQHPRKSMADVIAEKSDFRINDTETSFTRIEAHKASLSNSLLSEYTPPMFIEKARKMPVEQLKALPKD